MPPESWLVITVAAAFLLLGIAGSPLAWAMLAQRRTRFEQAAERTASKFAGDLRSLDERLSRLEMTKPVHSNAPDLLRADSAGGRGAAGARPTSFNKVTGSIANSASRAVSGGRGTVRTDLAHEPMLIAVPNLEEAPGNRQFTVGGLRERYAAIWTLADKGASAEVIARATGQPVGQIELILGLRRRIDGIAPDSSHSPDV